MIFVLHRLFTRKGFEGYSAAHHYSDVAIGAAAATTLAIKALGEGDVGSAQTAFETAAYLGAAVGVATAWRTALISEQGRVRAGCFGVKFLAGSVLAAAMASGMSALAEGADAGHKQQARLLTQWDMVQAKQPNPLHVCAPRVSGPERVFSVLKCDTTPFPRTWAL